MARRAARGGIHLLHCFAILIFPTFGLLLHGSEKPVAAAPIKFAFTGTLSGAYAPLVPYIGDGTISGSFIFDPTTPGQSLGPDGTNYENSIISMNFTSGGGGLINGSYLRPEPFPSFGGRIRVADTYSDLYQVSVSGSSGGLAGPTLPNIRLADWDLTLIALQSSLEGPIASEAIPLTPPNLNDFLMFRGIRVWYEFGRGVMSEASYRLDSLTLVANDAIEVSEPAAWGVFSLGVSALALMRRRRKLCSL